MSVNAKARRKAKRLRNQPQPVEPSGDTEDVAPRSISVVEFAAARAVELQAMKRAVESSSSTKRPFQTLPRHMRRRAASYNPKRLPKRLRAIVGDDSQSLPEGKKGGREGKRKSRRFRRRAKCLRKEYVRRQNQKRWLETHIWHAKRMHMVDLFGFRLAEKNAGKGVRAAYRAVQHGCLLHDMSYYSCIQLTGNQSFIIKALEAMTPPDTAKSLQHRHVLDGSHEQNTLLYKKHSYPYHVIGPTQLLWQQEASREPSDTPHRSVWLWMHPSCSKEALEEFQTLCSDESEKNMTIELVDDLLRFRLIGPSSHAILSDLLHSGESKPPWLNGLSGPEQTVDVCSGDGWEFWREMAVCGSPSSVPPHVVVGLTVIDPRHYLPQRKVDMVSRHYPKKKSSKFSGSHLSEAADHQTLSTGVACLSQTTADKKLAVSFLWSCAVRQSVRDTKLSDHEINLQRSKLPIPGTLLPTTDKTSYIPLLLIQQEGSRDVSQFGCGWDIILPAGWAMAFWIALIYRGARVAALKDMERVDVEMGKLSFPQHFPDSFAGQQKATIDQQQAEERYLRYPPDKRPNYAKLGVTTPFAASWDRLVELGTNQQGDEEPKAKKLKANERTWYILRSKETLSGIQQFISSCHAIPQSKRLPCEVETLVAKQLEYKGLSRFPFSLRPFPLSIPSILHQQNVLIRVLFTMVHRGTPNALAMVCLPSTEDVASLLRNRTFAGPTEPVHSSAEESTEFPCQSSDGLKTMLVFNGLTTRAQIGYVVSGDFCFIKGCGRGSALCVASGLLQAIKNGSICTKPLILLRNTDSLQYRFAEFTVDGNLY